MIKSNIITLIFVLFISEVTNAENYTFDTYKSPPFSYLDSNNQMTGISVDLVNTIMTNIGHSVDIKFYPYERCNVNIRHEISDAVFINCNSPMDKDHLKYSVNLLLPRVVCFYVRKDSNIKYYGDLKTLKKYKIGTVSTICYGSDFNEIRDELNIHRGEDLGKNFKLLNSGRIDMVICNMPEGDYILKEMNLEDDLIQLQYPVQIIDTFITFSSSKNTALLRAEFYKELNILNSNGTYDKIIEKYIPNL